MDKVCSFSGSKLKLEQFFNEWLLLEGEHITEILNDDFKRAALASTSNYQDHTSITVSNTATALDSISDSEHSIQINKESNNEISTIMSRSPKKRTQSEMSSIEQVTTSSTTSSNTISPPHKESILGNSLTPEDHIDVLANLDNDNIFPGISSSRRRSNFDVIPKFYFRMKKGRNFMNNKNVEDQLSYKLPEIEIFFKQYPNGVPAEKFVHITKKLCGLPSFFNLPFCRIIYDMYGGQEENTESSTNLTAESRPTRSSRTQRYPTNLIITQHMLIQYWQTEIEPYTRMERFFRVIKQSHHTHICKDDFVPYLKELLHFHPGLQFLSAHDEFKRKYALTVITRIFYKVNISRTGRISYRELKNSNLLGEFIHVDEEIDINKVTEYFSYEHFYVLYCRFFELDMDKDGKLGLDDLGRYGDYCLSDAIIERIFHVGIRAFSDGIDEGFQRSPRSTNTTTNNNNNNNNTTTTSGNTTNSNTTTNNEAHNSPFSARLSMQIPDTNRLSTTSTTSAYIHGGMTFADFIYFMLAEEDKGTLPAIKFWFNCCDMDGDGKLTYPDLWHFYRCQLDRVANMGQDAAPFKDVLCQMLDHLNPIDPLAITIDDMIKPDKLYCSGLFFDVLFNLHKFMRFEMRDPFQDKLRREDGFQNEWNRFAYYEYIKLASEEEQGTDNDSADSEYNPDSSASNLNYYDDDNYNNDDNSDEDGTNNTMDMDTDNRMNK